MQFVVAKLKDPKTSYVEILVFKLNVREHLLDVWLPRSGMHVDNITKIRVYFDSFATVRATVTNFPGQDPADASWQCAMIQSGVGFCEFAEKLVYSTVYNSRYKDAIKSKLEVAAFYEQRQRQTSSGSDH